MRSILILLLSLPFIVTAQSSDWTAVYNIMQVHCASCHNATDIQGGLNLVGTGATPAAKMDNVYAALVNATPNNEAAAARGFKLVEKGRADRSFLFLKSNADLDPYYTLGADEGSVMPNNYGADITLKEREMIRQWILAGADKNTLEVDTAAMNTYFSGLAQNAFDVAPAAPLAEEGFQFKMGPFYLKPGAEIEFYQKYKLYLPEAVEVPRIDMKIAGYSHHFIMYHYNSASNSNGIIDGLRLSPYHSNIKMTTAVQEATNLLLPSGTAFKWPQDRVLDLNSHYINYSQSLAYRAEVYVNIYTQPAGTTAQEMYSELYANNDFYLQNNGNPVTQTDWINYPIGNVWVWGLMGHTHKYGTGYKIYSATANGTPDQLLYNASCPQAAPDCVSPYYDYQHIPLKLHEPLMEINMTQGVVQEATWVNDGPEPVGFGPTSDDEMMVMVAMFTLDTTGLNMQTVDDDDELPEIGELNIFPNPAVDNLEIDVPNDWIETDIIIMYAGGGGQALMQPLPSNGNVSVAHLPVGLYFVICKNKISGEMLKARLVVAAK